MEGKCSICNEVSKMICSGCRCVRYCCSVCQKKDWSEHKFVCLSSSMSVVAQAMEIALLGRPSCSGKESLEVLKRCFPRFHDSKAVPLLEKILMSAYFPPVVSVDAKSFVAFYPFCCLGVSSSLEGALDLLRPYCKLEIAGALPPQKEGELRVNGPGVLNYAQFALIMPVLGRFSEPQKIAMLAPEDLHRPSKVSKICFCFVLFCFVLFCFFFFFVFFVMTGPPNRD